MSAKLLNAANLVPHGDADLDFYTWPTPNGRKIAIFLAEADVAFNLIPVNTTEGAQFSPAYLSINPNNKIPTIVDFRRGKPHSVFESGAILLHLAEREGRFVPRASDRRSICIQWLMWQMGGFGPMLGQAHHFNFYAPEKLPYAIDRYNNEARRLYGVLDRRLAVAEFVAEEYSIADMAIWPWLPSRKLQGIDLDAFPNVARWNATMKARAGVRRGYDLLLDMQSREKPTNEQWDRLFGSRQFG